MLIDSHCHLDYYTALELPDVLQRAAAAGVGEMVTIGTTMAQSATLPAVAEAHPNLWCTIGVHPHHAAEAPIPTPEALAAMAEHPKVIGIGESGLLLRPVAARRAGREFPRPHPGREAGLCAAMHPCAGCRRRHCPNPAG